MPRACTQMYIFLNNFNSLSWVQVWVQAGCNGCKLGAGSEGCFEVAPSFKVASIKDLLVLCARVQFKMSQGGS